MRINGEVDRKFGQGKQLNLWDDLMTDPGPALKLAMHEAVKQSSLSREQIADTMNKLAAMAGIRCNGKSQKVTLALLDKWIAPGAVGHNIPLRMLPIFCRAAGSNLPLEVYAKSFRGARVVSEDDHHILQWAHMEIQCRQARKMARKKSQEIGIE